MSVDQVQGAFGTYERPLTTPVAKDSVIGWARSTNIEVLGLLYRYLSTAQYLHRIVPSVTREEVVSMAINYLGRCVIEDPQGTHTHNRYEAGWEIVSLFRGLWKWNESRPQECERMKQWLAGIVKAGDREVQSCIVNATLEHLFEEKEIANFFKDWNEDPALGRAYADAMLWPEQGGSSPIGKGD